MRNYKTHLNDALNNQNSKNFLMIQALLTLFTIVSVGSIILETVPALVDLRDVFTAIERVSLVVFSLEYIARIIASENKIAYIFSFWGVIDLTSILPTFLGLGNWTFLKVGRTLFVLRLLRMLRIAKIIRSYLKHNEDNMRSQDNLNKTTIGIYFLALFTAITSFGAIFYTLESVQEPYSSIPLAMLESAKILIGEAGAVFPQTLAGQIVLIFARLVGLALFGLLINVIGGILERVLFEQRSEK